MDNDDDFTFCQVSSPVEDEQRVETKNLVSHVGRININDEETSEGSGCNETDGSLWRDKDKDKSRNEFSSKQETAVGTLSFRVIDATAKKRLSESGTVDSSMKVSPSEVKVSVKKPTAGRAKVPFEKGCSQMDWMKLTRTHPDLAGLKGQSNKRLISMDEVRQNQREGSMWTVLKGRVYNISPYMKFHPGGVDMLMKAVGKDCTLLFNKYHAWVNAEFLLEKCLVGLLDDSK